jgi:hypothetical protein
MGNKYICAMEAVDQTMASYLTSRDWQGGGTRAEAARLNAIYQQVARLIGILWKLYNFKHRDLHTRNVMLDRRAGVVRAYLIDYGDASLTVRGRTLDAAEATNEPVYNFDLVTFFGEVSDILRQLGEARHAAHANALMHLASVHGCHAPVQWLRQLKPAQYYHARIVWGRLIVYTLGW